jgi:predicted nucleotidyltransferase
MLPSQILQKRRAGITEIMKSYPMFSNLRVVGSVARGEDNEDSDIDFLVDAAHGTTLIDIGGLREDFEKLLGVEVDIITSGTHLTRFATEFFAQDAVPL